MENLNFKEEIMMVYVIISLILGITSWVIAIWNFKNEKRKEKYIVISFVLSLCSIYPQILLMSSYGDDWVPVIDTVGAMKTVIPILIIITTVLNVMAVRMKTRSENF